MFRIVDDVREVLTFIERQRYVGITKRNTHLFHVFTVFFLTS